jgi:tyrosyl-tRNA synthetase
MPALAKALHAAQQRGLLALHSIPVPAIASLLRAPAFTAAQGSLPATLYAGFDPTAPSLHIGHLPLLLLLRLFKQEGIRPIALIGGATGRIGDPTGRKGERKMLTPEELKSNSDGIETSIRSVLNDSESNNDNNFQVVNNATFYEGMGALDYIRDVCSHMRVSAMLAKDSVSARLEAGGLSLAEFNYATLQSYDFYRLAVDYNCRVQLGGSDQWGNITSGIDFTKRKLVASGITHEGAGDVVAGLTVPLVTTSTGVKIGKSEGNAVFLNAEQTSHHAFYQYLLNTADADVRNLLCLLTTIPVDIIDEIMTLPAPFPQKTLATAVTTLVRGSHACTVAVKSAELLFSQSQAWSDGGESVPDAETLEAAISANLLQSQSIAAASVLGKTLEEITVVIGMFKSKSEARRAITGGGLSLNKQKINEFNVLVQPTHAIGGRFVMISKGKRDTRLLLLQATE